MPFMFQLLLRSVVGYERKQHEGEIRRHLCTFLFLVVCLEGFEISNNGGGAGSLKYDIE